MPSTRPGTYLTAGTLEPFVLQNATHWADALRGAGADVVMTERDGNYGDAFWQAELPLMVSWAAPNDKRLRHRDTRQPVLLRWPQAPRPVGRWSRRRCIRRWGCRPGRAGASGSG